MNSEQAKKLSLPEILSRMGYDPVSIRKGGNEYWYCSPFRTEKEASFHTSFLGGQWIWNDFGDSGGTVIDFVLRHEGFSKVSDALHFLDKMFYSKRFKYKTPAQNLFSSQEQPSTLELIKVIRISNKALLGYLVGERKIKLDVVFPYLSEIHYKNTENGKLYFAFGIQNRSDGFEIRNRYFKSSIGQKDFSFFKGTGGQNAALVFEGFLDFFSYLTHQNILRPEEDVIILNSASYRKPVLDFIKSRNYQSIFTYFDNDNTGTQLTSQFSDELTVMQVRSMNHIYADFKDYNDYLVHAF